MKQINNLQQLVSSVLADKKQAESIARFYHTNWQDVQGEAWLQANNSTVNFASPDAEILGYVWKNVRYVMDGEQPSEFIVRSVKMSAPERKSAPILKKVDACGNPLPKRNMYYKSITYTSSDRHDYVEQVAESYDETGYELSAFEAELIAQEGFEIRNSINGLAKVKGSVLADRTKREKIQLNAEHFEMGDLETGRIGKLVVVKKSGRKPKKKVFSASKDTQSFSLFGSV